MAAASPALTLLLVATLLPSALLFPASSTEGVNKRSGTASKRAGPASGVGERASERTEIQFSLKVDKDDDKHKQKEKCVACVPRPSGALPQKASGSMLSQNHTASYSAVSSGAGGSQQAMATASKNVGVGVQGSLSGGLGLSETATGSLGGVSSLAGGSQQAMATAIKNVGLGVQGSLSSGFGVSSSGLGALSAATAPQGQASSASMVGQGQASSASTASLGQGSSVSGQTPNTCALGVGNCAKKVQSSQESWKSYEASHVKSSSLTLGLQDEEQRGGDKEGQQDEKKSA